MSKYFGHPQWLLREEPEELENRNTLLDLRNNRKFMLNVLIMREKHSLV